MLPDDSPQKHQIAANMGVANKDTTRDKAHEAADAPGLWQLAFCVAGIYASLYV